MKDEQKRQQLLNFLDNKIFEPILNASPDQYSDAKQPTLDDVKKKNQSERHRFRQNYGSAEEVKQNFESDVSSQAAEKVNRELKELGLPRLADYKQQL